VLLYSTVKVWPACEVTSKTNIPPLQMAFVSVSWPPIVVVKVPPVNPLKEAPAVSCPLITVHQIVRSDDGLLRRIRNLCLSAVIEAVRDQVRTVDLKQVNRVLIQPHWRHDCDPPLA